MVTLAALQKLQAFRSKLYGCCTRRRDARFELVDALLTADSIPSLAYLSLEPVHRRGWGSTYAALATGRWDAEALRTLLARHQLAGGQPIYAVDVSTWPRCDAEASPERGFYYHPSRHSAGQPIVAAWAYQWIAQLGFARNSWTAPVDARRLRPCDNANQVAVTQVRALLQRLPAGQAPLFVFDAGYDPVQLGQGLAGTGAAILVRLRAGRCFYADPPPAAPGRVGRPRRHGAKLDTDDPSSWPAPTAVHASADGQFGTVVVAAWEGLHPKPQLHPTRGTKQPRPIVRGTLVRVQVSRIPARTRPPKVLWLWWQGPGTPDLEVLWRAYVRRFDLEIVCTQVTKPCLGAAWCGGDHVADLHVAVGDHHPVDQQLHQLAALLEAGLVKARSQLVQHLGHGLSDRAHLSQPLTLSGDLSLACQQVRLLAGKALVLPLEAGQVDHLGQVGLQQPLPLAGHARPDAV